MGCVVIGIRPVARKTSPRVAAALITAGGVVVAALGVALFTWLTRPPLPEVTLDRISLRGDHRGISATDGVDASGTAKHLVSGSTIWLLDKDSDSFTVATEATRLPGDRWSAESFPLGDDEPLPFEMSVAVVLADTECANALRAAQRDSESYLPALPEGCQEMDADRITVSEP